MHLAYSRVEEKINVLTHAAGVFLSLTGLVYLSAVAYFRQEFVYLLSGLVFGFSMVVLYLSSTLYHLATTPLLKQIFRIFDHSSIYLLIAGTYTPIVLISIPGHSGYTLLTFIWLCAILGVFLSLTYISRFKTFSILIYLTMGWLSVLVMRHMLANIPMRGIYFLVAGGLLYSFGVVFYVWKSLPFNHAIWHLFVLAGTISHFCTIAVIYTL